MMLDKCRVRRDLAILFLPLYDSEAVVTPRSNLNLRDNNREDEIAGNDWTGVSVPQR